MLTLEHSPKKAYGNVLRDDVRSLIISDFLEKNVWEKRRTIQISLKVKTGSLDPEGSEGSKNPSSKCLRELSYKSFDSIKERWTIEQNLRNVSNLSHKDIKELVHLFKLTYSHTEQFAITTERSHNYLNWTKLAKELMNIIKLKERYFRSKKFRPRNLQAQSKWAGELAIIGVGG